MSLVVVAFLMAGAADPVAAGEAATATGVAAQEIVVTGERVPRPLRETPSSVEVFTARDIADQRGSDRLEDLLERVPNIQFGTGGQGPTIRGQDTTGVLQDLPAFLGGTRPRVTVQVDGRAVGFNEFVFGITPLWDVQQVEVFRSPQTTTQGRNSIAGAIVIDTRDPVYRWEAAGRALAGSSHLRQFSAVASGPLVADQLAFRLAGDVRRGQPSSEIADRMRGASPDHDDYALLRLKLLAEPRALPGVRLEAAFSHSQSLMPQIEGVRAPFRDRRDPSAGYGIFRTRVDALTMALDWTLGAALRNRTVASLGHSRARRFAPAGLGEADNRVDDRSIESVFDWRPRAGWRLTGGVHHLRTRLDQAIDLSAVIGDGKFADRQRSTGLFGEATVRPLPRLSLTAGLRLQRDSQDRQGRFGDGSLLAPIDFQRTFTSWLPKASVAYDLAPAVTAGLMVQRASNPGGVTLNFETGEPILFDAESLWSHELFARAQLAGGLRLAANLFYQRMRDAQRARSRSFVRPGQGTAVWAEIHNVPRAESYGAEASLEWSPSRRLRMRLGLGLLETRILEFDHADFELEGKDFQRAPAFTGMASADWTPTDRLRLGLSARHNGGYFSDDANTPSRQIGRATRIDGRASYDFGATTLFGYVRNLLDDFNMTYLFSPNFGTAADPREFGLGVESRF